MESPIKLCECGCGQPAPIATRNRPERGYIKGQPLRFILGHSKIWKAEDSYISEAERERRKRYKRNSREKKQAVVLEYLSTHPCVDCGIQNPIVLDFDHINQADKTAGIADLICMHQIGLEKIKEEMEKCEIRCANCHRIKHFQDKSAFSFRRQVL